ncbi:BspA family leucine-rich repeat surface protein [Campylobacter sp. 2457A]|uniref:BspA family leucine-rich repeat surface protein n=1 Tax=Campylobacter sp. 2457A TaxID=2735784 RepID=UPI00301CBF49
MYLNSLESAFMYRERFDGIESWDVSHIKNFPNCFYHCENMNIDLSKWDVGKGQEFISMFEHARYFNQNLNKWDMSKAKNINKMFYCAFTL